jgi:uncharacterized protein (DUF305 family)
MMMNGVSFTARLGSRVTHPSGRARSEYPPTASEAQPARALAEGRPKRYPYNIEALSTVTPNTPVSTLAARVVTVVVLVAPLTLGCSHPKTQEAPAPATSVPPAAAAPDHHMEDMAGMPGMSGMSGMSMPVNIPKGALYTEADVRFMQGMIAHHSQAIYMSRLAAARGAGPRLLKFALKIDQSQKAEITLMQDWLRANKQVTPDTSSWRTMTMPGMLTAAQLSALDAARGPDFDRQFLTLMIQHHRGALSMVADLFASPLAAQDVDVSVFANDVDVVQTAEIALMQQMLAES